LRDVLVRKIEVSRIKDVVKRLWMEANFVLPDDVMEVLREAQKEENSEIGRDVLGKIIENALIAKRKKVPICQDTGIPVVFVFAGQEVQITGGGLEEAIEQGIREGTEDGLLRSSVVNDALARANTGDNTPPVVHTEIVDGDGLKIIVMPKGAGSENMSGLAMLKPADGMNGIKAFVLKQVESAGANACPPMVVGVGVGGTAEKAMQLAKKACARPLTERSRKMAEFERELLEEINRLGIGPAGLGGRTTALAVNIETAACHMASLPVAVNLNCHACRRKEAIL
jgi:fumarate hydratase subunit alpha